MIDALNTLILRILSNAPAGKLSFTLIDPVGLQLPISVSPVGVARQKNQMMVAVFLRGFGERFGLRFVMHFPGTQYEFGGLVLFGFIGRRRGNRRNPGLDRRFGFRHEQDSFPFYVGFLFANLFGGLFSGIGFGFG